MNKIGRPLGVSMKESKNIQKKAYYMYYYANKTQKEIAELLTCNRSSVSRMIKRQEFIIESQKQVN